MVGCKKVRVIDYGQLTGICLEAISMVQLLISQNSDIQKVLAFEGAFEKLFNIVTQEGGIEGGITAEGALSCVDTLLRFNSSNQVSQPRISVEPMLF